MEYYNKTPLWEGGGLEYLKDMRIKYFEKVKKLNLKLQSTKNNKEKGKIRKQIETERKSKNQEVHDTFESLFIKAESLYN